MIVRDRIDRRSERTRRLLNDALVALMMEKQYSAITVQEIVERANVGRSTFYAHFQDKDDLLSYGLGRVVEELRQNIATEHLKSNLLLPSLELFRHIKDHFPLYKAVFWQPGLDFMPKAVQKLLSQSIERQFEMMLTDQNKPSTPLTVVSDYAASAFLTLLQWWLDNDVSYSPERMDELFQQLVMPGVQAALGIRL